jgi:two-component system NarL family sensor kinase
MKSALVIGAPPPVTVEAVEPSGRGQWVMLSGPRLDNAADRPINVRHALLQLALAALVVVTVVGVAGSVMSRRIAEQQSVHDAAQITDTLAESVVRPALSNEMLNNPAAAAKAMAPLLGFTSGTSVVRSKLWQPTPAGGRILYSDETRLNGLTFPFDDEAENSLTHRTTEASISDLRRPENVYERDQGKLLEVYRPVWNKNGSPLLYEAYFRYDEVTARSHDLWRGFSGIMLSSLAAVFVLLLPLLWTLLSRTRRAQVQREEMMRRAVDASQEERRRIAGTLHDGVVQQLVAASYAVAGEAERAAGEGDSARAARLSSTAGTVRDSVAGMRSLLVDIYPPSLRTGGLSAALHDLARTTSGRDVEIGLAVEEELAAELTTEQQQAVFRVAQDCLRNAVKHAQAGQVHITLMREGDVARLEVEDDGIGFDHLSAVQAVDGGHFGLSLMTDTAGQCGGVLSVATGPGSGTCFRLEVPLR